MWYDACFLSDRNINGLWRSSNVALDSGIYFGTDIGEQYAESISEYWYSSYIFYKTVILCFYDYWNWLYFFTDFKISLWKMEKEWSVITPSSAP